MIICYAKHMINPHFLQKIKIYCMNTVTMQLFLFLLSLPIIVAWGLPVSIMTLISTPLFGPALTLFLLISTLIFLCMLCSLPYSLLLTLLDKIVLCWDYALSLGSPHWLFCFSRPPVAILTVWSIWNALFLLYVLQSATARRLRLLLGYSCVVILLLYVQRYIPYQSTLHFSSKSGTLQLIFENNQAVVIDRSFFARQKSADSWIKYTLIPALITHNGHTTIEAYILTKPSKNTINSLLTLTKHCTIQHIITPYSTTNSSDPLFCSLIDKQANNSGIMTCINEPNTLYATCNLTFHIRYNREKKRLEI